MAMRTAPQRYRQAAVESLTPHPRNPNQGDVGAIHTSIEANGFYGAILVQKSSQHVIAGNHRLVAAVAAGAAKVPVIELDVDDETALRIMLADNRTAALATNDDQALADLLSDIAARDDLLGTGYDGDDLDTLLTDLSEPFKAEPEPPVKTSTIVGKRTCPACGHEWIEGQTDGD